MAKAAKTHNGSRSMKDPGALVFKMFQVYFAAVLIVVGLDKFFYILNDWSSYISPFVMQLCNCQDRHFMGVVGLIEIIVGIGVVFKPRIFGYIICLFLIGVILNLIMTGKYFDIAIRDLGLLLAAFSMAKLSSKYLGKKA